MCGIVGNVYPHSDGTTYLNRSKIRNSLLALSHRGPDDSGHKHLLAGDWEIDLGQTRLSIIDLSKGGHQPFISQDSNYVLIFNGEIYNYLELKDYLSKIGYSFYTKSDTEVLLNAWIHWGFESLPKLKGMFAFAIYDKRSKSLTLVRDAFGIKPLFYNINEKNFSFASEIDALKKVCKQKIIQNNQTLFKYLAYNIYDDVSQSFFERIHRLEPGHFLTLDISDPFIKPKISRWWWPNIEVSGSISELKAAEELREMFLNNISLHLRSDVPVGVALSGGIDSSSIVCALRYLQPNMDINTFSFVTPGDIKDEEIWIDLVNKHVGAKAHKVTVSPSELADDLDDMIKFQGEPFGDTSIYAQYRVYRLAKQSGIKVTMDGQGADELFAGYFGYPEWRIRSLLASGNIPKAINFLLNWRNAPGRSLSEALEGALSISLPKSFIPLANKFLSKRPLAKVFNLEEINNSQFSDLYPLRARHQIGWDRALVSKLRQSLTGGDLSRLLRYVDRNSMRWSIESRVPFLTTDLAEFTLSLPEEYLVSPQGITKYIFRQAMQGIVPDEIINRRDKIGFETPELFWLKFLKDDVNIWLESLDELPWINIDEAKTYFYSVLNGYKEFDRLTWRLINAARWYSIVVLD